MSGYDGNGEGYFSAHGKGGDHGGSSSYDAFEDRNSLQKNNSRESDRGRPRTRERDRDREKDRDRSYRDSKDRSSRADRGKGRHGDYDRLWHDYDRHRDYDRDRERRDGHRSRSRSKDRSRKLSRSPSRSKSAIGGAEGPDRIFVGGLPYFFTEAQIRELLESFGPLRGFDLVKDRDTGNFKGYGFCVYQDPAVTDIACGALNGLRMGVKTLTVRRATVSSGQAKSEQENILAQAQQFIAIQKMVLQAGDLSVPGGIATAATEETPTKVLCLTEAITLDELKDDEEYEEILEDMRDECGKFGALVDIIIPRPNPNGEQTRGVGKVFLEYSDTTSCASARNVLNGRKFGGNTVSAVYFPEDKFYNRDYSE